MTRFSAALELLLDGKRVARAGWNGKGMWIMLVTPEQCAVGSYAPSSPAVASFARSDVLTQQHYKLLPWIGMKTADDKFVPWLASQTDILAEDWAVIE